MKNKAEEVSRNQIIQKRVALKILPKEQLEVTEEFEQSEDII